MALGNRKEKKEDRFQFPGAARKAFAKEMGKIGFDFDKFLMARGAIMKIRGNVTAMEYQSQEEQQAYIAKFVKDTPYYSLEAITLEWAWRMPFTFWCELRAQSAADESRVLYEVDRAEEIRTGESREVRAQKALKSLSQGLTALGLSKSYAAL